MKIPIRNISLITLVWCLMFGNILAQSYTVKWNNPATYSLSCGNITGNQWTISNDSCVFLSASISPNGKSGDPDVRAAMSIQVNPTGNMEPNDRLWVRVYTDAVLKHTITVRGDTVSSIFNLNLEIMVPAVSQSQIEVMANTDQGSEKWRIADEGISMTFPPAPLPVELASFRGDLKDSQVTLGWITRAEINNDYFTIERSQDGQKFKAVAKIKGKGTTTVLSQYTYSETYVENLVVYYRLMQTDFDGTSKYMGKTITLKPKRMKSMVSLFPNPARSQEVHLVVTDCKNSEVIIELRNTNGRILYSRTVYPADDLADIELSQNEITLNEGLYLVTVRTGTEIQSERLVITN